MWSVSESYFLPPSPPIPCRFKAFQKNALFSKKSKITNFDPWSLTAHFFPTIYLVQLFIESFAKGIEIANHYLSKCRSAQNDKYCVSVYEKLPCVPLTSLSSVFKVMYGIQLFNDSVGNSQNYRSRCDVDDLMHGLGQQCIGSSTAPRKRWFQLLPMKAWMSCFITQLIFLFLSKHKLHFFLKHKHLFIYLFIY